MTNSGGSPFYTDIVGGEQFAKTKNGGISGIKVNDKTGEIVINLVRPRGTFTNELGLMFVAPVPQNTPEEDQSANPPPASGPYMITKSQPARGWDYERNPYWAKDNGKGCPKCPAATSTRSKSKCSRNQSTQVNDIESGKLNWIFDPPPTDRYQEVKEKFEGTQFKTEPTISHLLLLDEPDAANRSTTRKFAKPSTTRSIPAALERIYTGQIVGTQQILPPGMPGYKKFDLFPHNVKKAKELIAEAGLKDKEITVWTDSESPNNDAGEPTMQGSEEIGLKAELKILNPDNYFTVIGNKSTPNLDTGFADWFEDFPHPNDFFDILLNGESIQPTNNQNFSQISTTRTSTKRSTSWPKNSSARSRKRNTPNWTKSS